MLQQGCRARRAFPRSSVGTRSTARSRPAAWRPSTSGGCSGPSGSRAPWPSSGCTRTSRGIPSSSRCSSTRRASRRASGTPTSCPTLDVVSRSTASCSSSWSTCQGESLARLLRAARTARRADPGRASSSRHRVRRPARAARGARGDGRAGRAARASCTATSPRRTSSSAPTAYRACSTSASPRPSGRIQTTREGQLKGKLAYMAPEQLSSAGTVDRRTDVYAAAVVLWETLTRQRLFRGRQRGDRHAQRARAATSRRRARSWPGCRRSWTRSRCAPWSVARASLRDRARDGARPRAGGARRERDAGRGVARGRGRASRPARADRGRARARLRGDSLGRDHTPSPELDGGRRSGQRRSAGRGRRGEPVAGLERVPGDDPRSDRADEGSRFSMSLGGAAALVGVALLVAVALAGWTVRRGAPTPEPSAHVESAAAPPEPPETPSAATPPSVEPVAAPTSPSATTPHATPSAQPAVRVLPRPCTLRSYIDETGIKHWVRECK